MRTTDNHTELHEIAAAERSNPFGRVRRRLSAIRRSTIVFYMLGLVAIWSWSLPSVLAEIKQYGFTIQILGGAIPLALIALTMLISQQISVDSAADMVRSPGRFFLVMLMGIASSYAVLWAFDMFTASGIYAWFINHHRFPNFFRFGLFFTPFSWLSFLYLQQVEDEARFATLSIERSILGREIAQSRLLAARAQIDPKMVIRILGAVHVLYQTNADGASRLMDNMISYLRLAMNRLRDKNPSFDTELALLRSYFSLCEVESAVKINLRMNVDHPISLQQTPANAPIFLIAKKIFEEGVAEDAKVMTMQIDIQKNLTKISIDIGRRCISPERKEGLQAGLAALSTSAGKVMHHISESGDNRYVIQVQTQSDIP